MPIQYVIGDATQPQAIEGKKSAIVHICNDVGLWGAGFVMALSKRWPQTKKLYEGWHETSTAYVHDTMPLGHIQNVPVEDDIMVINMIGQRGVGRHRVPIRYDAVKEALQRVAGGLAPHRWSIHMPRIGCGLAGGRWDTMEPIIAETLEDYDVLVYDLPGVQG